MISYKKLSVIDIDKLPLYFKEQSIFNTELYFIYADCPKDYNLYGLTILDNKKDEFESYCILNNIFYIRSGLCEKFKFNTVGITHTEKETAIINKQIKEYKIIKSREYNLM